MTPLACSSLLCLSHTIMTHHSCSTIASHKSLLLLPVGSHCFSGGAVWGDLLSCKFPPSLYASVHPIHSFLCFCLLHAGFLLDLLFYLENEHDMILWRGHGSVVGWGTVLQAGSSRVQFSMRALDFFNLPNPSNRTMGLESIWPLTEMSTRKVFLGGKGRWVCKADNLTTVCELIV
jgi:hypothetical protein